MSTFYQDNFHFQLSTELDLEFGIITPKDQERLSKAFELLSVDSRYKRFLSYFKHLSPEMLDYLTGADQRDHIAWGAKNHHKPNEPGVGTARFIRDKHNMDTAEIAITVIDSYQGKGIGNVLFGIMYHLARFHAVKFFKGSVIPENVYVLNKLRDMCSEVTFDGYVYQFELPIFDRLDQCTQSDSMKRFQQVFEQIGEKLFSHETNT